VSLATSVSRIVLPRSREASNRIVVDVRRIEYPRREKAHWQPPKPPSTKGKLVDDPGGTGTAIVHEVRACQACAVKLRSRESDDDPPAMLAA